MLLRKLKDQHLLAGSFFQILQTLLIMHYTMNLYIFLNKLYPFRVIEILVIKFYKIKLIFFFFWVLLCCLISFWATMFPSSPILAIVSLVTNNIRFNKSCPKNLQIQ